MRTGELKGTDAEHPASGRVIVADGKIKLEAVSITEAPDARVILAKNFDEPSGVRCGSLEGFTGSHEYDIGADVNVEEYDSVVIWCDKFSVPIGLAELLA
jgi:hypothetical protein